ncbi:hypothetical protein GWI33_017722 [Rhynchophorus ferrugineus]|uniref:Uncharacterized protein n=1 Tax=Rhynchophorus ferrugineus TaxID=354439 RepID=A0A834M5Z0_RHYFE|nr:hypothetical protein GWI33_017722 [Rhynchophorus ferrugineus]
MLTTCERYPGHFSLLSLFKFRIRQRDHQSPGLKEVLREKIAVKKPFRGNPKPPTSKAPSSHVLDNAEAELRIVFYGIQFRSLIFFASPGA